MDGSLNGGDVIQRAFVHCTGGIPTQHHLLSFGTPLRRISSQLAR